MFRRHPGVYVQATLNNTYSYNDPFHMGRGQQGVYRFYIDKLYQKNPGSMSAMWAQKDPVSIQAL